ncbi:MULTISPECIES: hypothetical protein [unclassified Mesorhizobium]|uniref:hypothetical protein n=1 Tax=unclassified Mesorhizobium TaxID=325217 RepID=UPI0015E39422|nr:MULTISPECIES: hypothetical protein [unclassified Mesorhizobium]
MVRPPHDAIPELSSIDDAGLLRLRAALHGEMRRRGLALSVGQVAEKLAIDFFNNTPGCPNLAEAAVGTANVDALSRRGDRYSIKGVLDARKTGTVYPDPGNPDRQLFEYLLVVQLTPDWTLHSIYEFDWSAFVRCRSWDKRMNAWYLGLAVRTLAQATKYTPLASQIGSGPKVRRIASSRPTTQASSDDSGAISTVAPGANGQEV